ncbi:MAG: hypothetical protein AABY86_17545 [Bdellovibrionota bacterium]
MRSFVLSSMVFLVVTSLLLGAAFAQKYHSANDSDVEFSLEEKNQGPRPFYIDKEAIEKAQKAQYASEKKEAIWYAKRLSKFLAQYREQKMAEQNRAVAERTYLAQQSMHNLSDDAKKLISAQAEQARAVMARGQYQEAVMAQAARNIPAQGTEVSRALASLERPVFTVFKHQPKRPHALKLWSKLGKRLAHKAQTAATHRRTATMRIVANRPSSLPLGLLSTQTTKAERRPASITPTQTRPEGLWQGVARKLSGALNNLKSKLFSW